VKRAFVVALLVAAPALAEKNATKTVALHWPAVMPCAHFTQVASSTAVTVRAAAATVLTLAADTPRWAALAPTAPIADAKSMRHNAATRQGWVAFGCGPSPPPTADVSSSAIAS
jgi:hypothetical protein